MPRQGKKFHAKIMLFGEYSLLYGSDALTIPFRKYGSRLVFPFPGMQYKQQKVALNSNEQLYAYYTFLANDKTEPRINELLNLDRFAEDLAQGMYLHSTIPSGYGLGSSGALVAALYDRYSVTHIGADHQTSTGLSWLKALFSRLEAYFHGSSSGIDPLSIFIQKPLLIGQNQNLSLTDLPQGLPSGSGGFFLVNTHIPRKTSELITIFKRKESNPAFKKIFLYDYVPSNNACIHALINSYGISGEEATSLPDTMHHLSSLQLDLFKEMIPDIFRLAWQEGLTTGKYAMKLCGAGGGGYILGYTDNYQTASEIWRKHHVEAMTLDGSKIHLQ